MINEDLGDSCSSDIVLKYFRDGHTLAQIGEMVSLSSQGVSYIISRSLRRLRRFSRAQILRYGKNFTDMMSQAKEELFATREKIELENKELEALNEEVEALKEEIAVLDKEINARYEILKGMQTEPSSEIKNDTDIETTTEARTTH